MFQNSFTCFSGRSWHLYCLKGRVLCLLCERSSYFGCLQSIWYAHSVIKVISYLGYVVHPKTTRNIARAVVTLFFWKSSVSNILASLTWQEEEHFCLSYMFIFAGTLILQEPREAPLSEQTLSTIFFNKWIPAKTGFWRVSLKSPAVVGNISKLVT